MRRNACNSAAKPPKAGSGCIIGLSAYLLLGWKKPNGGRKNIPGFLLIGALVVSGTRGLAALVESAVPTSMARDEKDEQDSPK